MPAAREPDPRRAGPRLRIPILLVAVALAVRFVPGWVAPFTMVHFVGLGLGPLIGVLGLLIWWPLARGLPRRDKWLGLGLAVGVLVLGFSTAHGTMLQATALYGLVTLQITFLAALILTRDLAWPRRRWILVAALTVGLLPWNMLRQDGQIGELTPELTARWRPTAEDLFLRARSDGGPAGAPAGPAPALEAEWPGYRGPARDGKAHGVRFSRDWEAEPPRELWRRRVGPGWSSFAVGGGVAFTQEQRGDDEVVVAYSLTDGGEIWARGARERFEEPAAGAGPRATPTLADGTVFALGAQGTLLALDAATGEPRWRRNLVEDLEAPLPTWGFSSSPLVVGRAVLVFAGAGEGRSLVAYDRAGGELLWTAGSGTMSYSSVHPVDLGGSDHVLMATDAGLEAFDPETGKPTWEFGWPLPGMARMVQPVVLDDGGALVLGTGYGEGSKRLQVERGPGGAWSVSEVWSSRFLKPYFNGLVCHEGTCYGFDGAIFTAIGADDGERRWKAGRYGHGQVLLLPEMDALLVVTEGGEVVLVEATPEEHRELARLRALDGKTWNHPVVAAGKLLVRNGEEAACYELPG